MTYISIDENEFIAQRREKLKNLRAQGFQYPNDFKRDSLAQELHEKYDAKDSAFFESEKISAKIAGRIMLCRVMGKASFIQVQDVSGLMQVYIRQNDIGEENYNAFKNWDLGDIIAAQGYLFKTKSGELSIHAEAIQLISKALRPLPDKFHGLTDRELRYRKRYVDLIANENIRKLFRVRTQIIQSIRQFLNERHFLEVETPMMQVLPGGAAAKPFVTHHHALDMTLYLRISPELYLKRLVVGGFERVYEINRNFRNEGISTQHNPEFTMIEFYQAYADYKELMDMTELLFKQLALEISGSIYVKYQGETFDFGKPFLRISMKNSILHFCPEISTAQLENLELIKQLAKQHNIEIKPGDGIGKIQSELFGKLVENKLIQPTFITEYPAEISPLARRNDQDASITDRFELFIAGREIANGFSELNDPEDQAERFLAQAKAKSQGDEEAMVFDADYIEALEYGMPPAAGEGIGIDRLVMLFTDSASIRDVLLFPHLKQVE